MYPFPFCTENGSVKSVDKFIFLMLRDIVELKVKMLKLRAIFIVEFCYNLATIHVWLTFSGFEYNPQNPTAINMIPTCRKS